MAYVTATSRWGDADPRRREAAAGREGRSGPRLHRDAETVNAVDAWLGSLPGHAYANVRQPPISTLNLAHMIPSRRCGRGRNRTSISGAPAALGKTGLDPVPVFAPCRRRRPHPRRRPDGAGKSVLLALMACSSGAIRGRPGLRLRLRRLDPRRRVRHGRRLARSRRRLTDGGAPSFRSLSRSPASTTTRERAWAADWIVAILMREGDDHAEVKEHLWTALTSLASAPVENARSRASRSYCSQTISSRRCAPIAGRRGLWPVARRRGRASRGGPRSRPSRPRVDRGPALRRPSLPISSTASVIASTAPTLLIVDEGWLALDDEGLRGQLREWLKTLRKKNASVIFATQSLPTSTAAHRARPSSRAARPGIFPPERTRNRAADHRHLPPVRPQRPPDRDLARRPTARLLLPVAARQPPVRAGPRRGRAGALRGLRPKPTRPHPSIVAAHGRDGFLAAAAPTRRRLGGRPHSRTSQSPRNPTCPVESPLFLARHPRRRSLVCSSRPSAAAPLVVWRDPTNNVQNVLSAAARWSRSTTRSSASRTRRRC